MGDVHQIFSWSMIYYIKITHYNQELITILLVEILLFYHFSPVLHFFANNCSSCFILMLKRRKQGGTQFPTDIQNSYKTNTSVYDSSCLNFTFQLSVLRGVTSTRFWLPALSSGARATPTLSTVSSTGPAPPSEPLHPSTCTLSSRIPSDSKLNLNEKLISNLSTYCLTLITSVDIH